MKSRSSISNPRLSWTRLGHALLLAMIGIPTALVAQQEPAAELTMQDVAANRLLWPPQVQLTRPLTLPIVVNGKTVGNANHAAGVSFRVVRVSEDSVEVSLQGTNTTIPADATNVLELARERQQKILSRPTPPPQVAATPRPTPEPTPEAAASGKYLAMAQEVMADIQNRFYDAGAGLYRAKEDGDHDMMWGNGVMFSAVVAAARHDPGKYRNVMIKFFEAMDAYWDTKVKIPGYEPAKTAGGGNDKYYDDNAWMVITFMEAYALTNQPRFKRRAEETLEFVLSGWDDKLGGGIYWHEQHKGNGKNTCSNGPAAVGCLALAPYQTAAKSKELIDWAKRIVEWTTKTFQGSNGLFGDSINVETKEKNMGQLTYNSGLMLRANLGLYRQTGDRAYLRAAQKIGEAGRHFLNDHGVYRDVPKFSHLMIEADLELYRETKDRYLIKRARDNADALYEKWKTDPPEEMIENAAIARTLWLMADMETDVGRKFHAQVEKKR